MKPAPSAKTRRRYHSIDAVLARAGIPATERRRAAERQSDLCLAADLEWLRCAAGLTQAEVARRMGVSQSTVSRIQSSPQAELRFGEVLGFLRAVGARSAQMDLGALASARPTVKLRAG